MFEKVKLMAFKSFNFLLKKDCSEEAKNIRIVAYSLSHSIMLCYDINKLEKAQKTIRKWKKELNDLDLKIPIVLVGLRMDIRNDLLMKSQHQLEFGNYVMQKDVLKILNTIKYLHGVVETSAKHSICVYDAFDLAIRASLKHLKIEI
jgi:GTPase SAR1 family protein